MDSPENYFTIKISRSYFRFAWYLFKRFMLIGMTVLAGVYLTVLVANKGSQIDNRVKSGIELQINSLIWSGMIPGNTEDEQNAHIAKIRTEMEASSGLSLPHALRNLRWTINALTMNWGITYFSNNRFNVRSLDQVTDVKTVLLGHLPNTLLLIGTADLLIFLIGIPAALFLAFRIQGSRLDRLVLALSPLSSVPSWIYGILLVAIFAGGLKLLPASGKYDLIPADNRLDLALAVGRHMILPVMAIMMGMLLSLIAIWRSYFLIHSEEDYVNLAVAKGLNPKMIERKYILRPTVPYILTSFALTLVGFWQVTTALEYFFDWPGIGKLYVNALPNFWGDQFYPGDMGIVISIVVIFSILLGIIVFMLDLVYAWVDPRIRLAGIGSSLHQEQSGKSTFRGFGSVFRRKKTRSDSAGFEPKLVIPREDLSQERTPVRRRRFTEVLTEWKHSFRAGWASFWQLMGEISKIPSAMIGLAIITLMVLGSIFTVFAYPYKEIGTEYYTEAVTGRYYRAKNAQPAWTNYFRMEKEPLSQILVSNPTAVSKENQGVTPDGLLEKTVETGSDGNPIIRFKTTLDYPYTILPQNIILHVDPKYEAKRPILTFRWLRPDGEEIRLKNLSVEGPATVFYSDLVNTRTELRNQPGFKTWFNDGAPDYMPAFYLLFGDPAAQEPRALPGKYTLEITGRTFEPDTDMEVELVMLGKVAGVAGTDGFRQDLIVPLLWGMPIALLIGVVGALLTTLVAMLLAAAGVWQGGWLDNLVQRLTEVNMILPLLAIGILIYALYRVNIWIILGAAVLLNVFGAPTKTFRSAFIQVKEAPYLEASRAYGASNKRIVFNYMIPRIFPLIIPQLVILIPAFVFLEATLAIFNVYDPRYPTWGKIINQALNQGAWWGGSRYWVLEPIGLLLLAGLGFSLLGFALERVLNPRLRDR